MLQPVGDLFVGKIESSYPFGFLEGLAVLSKLLSRSKLVENPHLVADGLWVPSKVHGVGGAKRLLNGGRVLEQAGDVDRVNENIGVSHSR